MWMSRFVPTGSAILFAVGLAVVVTWPAAIRPDVVLGHWNHPDCLSDHWLLVWVAERVMQGGDLLHNDQYYWPYGDYPLLAGNGSEGFIYLPFHLALGWPWGASWYGIAVLAWNGVAAWWAARRAGASDAGALVAAAAFGPSAYVIQELGSGRFSQADVGFVAVSLGWFLGVMRDLRDGRPPGVAESALFGAVWGVGAALYWYHGWFVALGVLAMAVPHLALCRAVPWRAALAWLAGGAAVVTGPLAWFLAHWSLIPGTDEGGSLLHPEAWGNGLEPALPFAVSGVHQGWAMALTAVGLAILGLAGARRAGTERVIVVQLVALAVFAWMLARGPHLFGEIIDPFTIAYGWASPLRRFWWPSRHMVLVHFAVAVLAARGASLLLDRVGDTRARWVAAFGLACSVPAALAALGDLWRSPLSTYETPAFYTQVRDLPDGVLAEVPISPRLAGNQQMLIYQLDHDKPLLLGHAMWVDRVRPDGWDAFVSGNSFLAGLMAWEEGRAPEITFRGDDLRALTDRGLRWIALNREYLPNGTASAYEDALDALFGRPVVRERGARLYDLQAWTGLEQMRTVPFKPVPPRLMANGRQPCTALRPESLGFHLLRKESRPFQGVHPTRQDETSATPTPPGDPP